MMLLIIINCMQVLYSCINICELQYTACVLSGRFD